MLNVKCQGNSNNQPIIFIHGMSQSLSVWDKQFQSKHLENYYLISFDLRGHGFSTKPDDVSEYSNEKLIADLDTIIKQECLQIKPILCGWSFGGYILCEYLKTYGEEDIAASLFISPMLTTGPDTEFANKEIKFELFQNLFSLDISKRIEGNREFIELLTKTPFEINEYQHFLAINLLMADSARMGFYRPESNDISIFSQLKKPTLIYYGTEDNFIPQHQIKSYAELNATIQLVEFDSGHMPFWELPEVFNQHLVRLAKKVQPINKFSHFGNVSFLNENRTRRNRSQSCPEELLAVAAYKS